QAGGFRTLTRVLSKLAEKLKLQVSKRKETIGGKTSYQWLFEGKDLSSLGRYHDALECFDMALQIDPGAHIVWKNKADVLVELRRYSEAIYCYKMMQKIRPSESVNQKIQLLEKWMAGEGAQPGSAWESTKRPGASERFRGARGGQRREARSYTNTHREKFRSKQEEEEAIRREWEARAQAQRERARREWRERQRKSSQPDYYNILGIDRAASQEEIKRAYRRKMKECHPDTLTAESSWMQEDALKMSKKVNEAYKVLGNIEERRKYDNSN
ncbi:MAG: DnaJ domain-containing protein, partial [Chloroflexota bacterium]|nr:DnaJ domain-containing protein [Chloroflexota bacterium]